MTGRIERTISRRCPSNESGSSTPWYASGPDFLGLNALEDQQLAGLVMWVPGGLAYLVGGLMIVSAWLAVPGVAQRSG